MGFHSGRPDENPDRNRACLVFHCLLFDAARDHGHVQNRADGCTGRNQRIRHAARAALETQTRDCAWRGACLAAMAVTQAKFWGVVVMGGAVLILFFLPWLDRSPVKSIRYRPSFHKALIMLFALNFMMLAALGTHAPSPLLNALAQTGTVLYFAFFLAMPFWSRRGRFKPVPMRLTSSH